MTEIEPLYIHLLPNGNIPELDDKVPFLAVLIIDSEVSNDWRNEVSSWLAENCCLYMMAWGLECSLWDDAVDWVNLEKFDYKDIPDDEFIMTTWHEDESLNDVFWFAKNFAIHPNVELERAVILDITTNARKDFIVQRYQQATYDDDDELTEPFSSIVQRFKSWFGAIKRRF